MTVEGWEQSRTTLPLRVQIEEYVKTIVTGEIPKITLGGYLAFRDRGSREESEKEYFAVRKQLTALGCYLQWADPTEEEKRYLNELLWSVANEFTWCLAAHLSYGEEGFLGEPDQVIDLFAAETAATLAELLTLPIDYIDPYIRTLIRHRIDQRVLGPFLGKSWSWETSKSNWCAVCAGAVGMTALLLEQGERKSIILERVDRAMNFYLSGFGEDGATEEGVGYWVYGFGFYIYYIAMRQELDPDYHTAEEVKEKLKRIAEFPRYMQISGERYVPFSDAGDGALIPTGLLSYLSLEFGVTPPICDRITAFDFEHCYRYAHISRNLRWTDETILGKKNPDFTHYFTDRQWLVQRKEGFFLAVKGGSNNEEHNHNDVGSFILAINGELILTDLGAGPYTADYFGAKRYEQIHTRSYWHNVPLVNGREQIATADRCEVQEVYIDGAKAEIRMELAKLYGIKELTSCRRSLASNLAKGRIILTDELVASGKTSAEEGFVSRIRPEIPEEGIVFWRGSEGILELNFDASIMKPVEEEVMINNHRNEPEKVYRLGLRTQATVPDLRLEFTFSMKYSDN